MGQRTCREKENAIFSVVSCPAGLKFVIGKLEENSISSLNLNCTGYKERESMVIQ